MSRVRQSMPASSQQLHTLAPLPEYQPLQYPLDQKSQETLASLATKYPFRGLQSQLQNASKALTDIVGDIHDQLADRENDYQKRKKRRLRDVQESGDTDDRDEQDEEEKSVEWTRTETVKMAKRMDTSMRQVIDSQESIAMFDKILKEIQQISANSSTQSDAQTQRTTNVTQPGSTVDDTDQSQEPPKQLTPLFAETIGRAKERYQAKTMRARYAQNNEYISFKRVMHETAHQTNPNGPRLQDPKYWFGVEEGGSPPPGVTGARAGEGEEEDDDDDEIAISRVNISTVCPITFCPYKDPVSSDKCPHSFEKSAIFGMIRKAPKEVQLARGRGVQPVRQEVRCPVPGCDSLLGLEDLHDDPVLIRKIKRIQRAKQLREEHGDDDEDVEGGASRGRQVEEISDADDSEDDIDRINRPARAPSAPRRVKQEKTQSADEIVDDEDEDNDDGTEDEDMDT